MKTVKSTMSFRMKFSIILLVTTGFSIPAVNTKDYPRKSGIYRNGCFVGGLRVQSCAEEFKNTLEPYLAKPTFGIDALGNSYENGYTQTGHVFPHCCAITTLRSCIVDKIGTICGDKPEKTVDSFVDEIVANAKLIGGNQPCDGKQFYYREESPLCWQFWGPVTGVIIMAILLIIVCCSCCIGCCLMCYRRGRNRQTITKVVQQPPVTANYTPLKHMV